MTGTYPILVRSHSMDHHGGTKSYHLMLISTADGRAVFIARWGRKGVFGEMKVMTGTKSAMESEYTRKERDKTRNGYAGQTAPITRCAANADDLVKAITQPVFAKMGASNVKHLDPNFDTTGMREVDDARTDEEGRIVRDTTRKADVREQLLRQQAEEMQSAYSSNDLFGRF